MCGITGIWRLNGEKLEKENLERFTDSLFHRGPDGSGYFIESKNQLGLGHRRLSILDLSESGKQPMSFHQRYWITYNGEVYNFIELRDELKTKGHSFKTDTDTEVILAAYHQWGKDCLYKFNGMWAFAIWDKEKEKLFIARDRFGVKPLNYLFIPGKLFAFASESIAFKHLEGFQRAVHHDNIIRAINDPNLLEGHGYTIFEGMYQLLAGHYMEISTGTKNIKQKRWWNTLDHIVKVPSNYNDQVEQFSDFFQNACKIRMRSDVPIASALSGGIDSSAVYCMLHHLMKNNTSQERIPENWQQAFVAVFPNTSVDEKHFAEKVIAYTGGNVQYIEPDYSNLVDKIKTTTILFDSIANGPLLGPTSVYGAMKQNKIKVSMDGDGADEMLYGYSALVAAAYSEAIIQQNESYAEDLLQIFGSMGFPEDREKKIYALKQQGDNVKNSHYTRNSKLKHIIKSIVKNLYTKKSYVPIEILSEFLTKKPLELLPQLTNKAADMGNLSYAELLLYFNFHFSPLPYLLNDFDKTAMQNSIEIRMPFMDWRLVTYSFSLPIQSKIGHGYTKRILRDAMKNKMPESILKRKLKMGFALPLKEWFNSNVGAWIYDEMNSQTFKTNSYWDSKKVLEIVRSNNKNKSWDLETIHNIWCVFNAHLIVSNNSSSRA